MGAIFMTEEQAAKFLPKNKLPQNTKIKEKKSKKPRASKYNASKHVVDGIKFDSQKEADRYKELTLLERIGKISELELQKEFELIPTQREPSTFGKRGGEKLGDVIERKCSYYADFYYKDEKGNPVVEDTKGMKLSDYIIKRKLMLYVHGIRIKEI